MRHFLISLLALVATMGLLGLAWVYLLPYVLPFVVAVFLSLLIDGPVTSLQTRLRLPRWVAVAIVLFGAYAALAAIATLIVAALRFELAALVASLPELLVAVQAAIERATAWAGALSERLPQSVAELLGTQLQSLYEQGARIASGVAEQIVGLARVPQFLFVLVIASIATYFFSRDKRQIAQFLLSLLPPEWKRRAVSAKADVFGAAIGLVKAQILLMSLTALLTLIGMNLIGSSYAISIAALVGLLDALPVLGPGILFLPWSGVAFVLGDARTGVSLLALYGALALIRQVLEPRVVGEQIGLHPLATLISFYVGLQVFGAAGVIYGPATVVIVKALVRSELLPIFRYEAER